jgi:IS5 family transposase
VTESNIHHPTDSALLYDGVRILSRWLKRARLLLPARLDGARLCQSHNRSARRRMQQIARWSRTQRAGRTSPRAAAKKKP